MATEQDTSKPDLALRPQTPAARRRNPAAHQRTAEERERLREESRARRKAREAGEVVAPEPHAHEIKVRRLSQSDEATATTAPPAPSPGPSAPAPSALKPSTPAAGAMPAAPPAEEAPREEALREQPAEALREQPAEALPEEALREEALREDALREEALREEALREDALREEALREEALRGVPPTSSPSFTRPAAPPRPPEERPAPASPVEPPPAPPTRRDRATALLALASAVGVVVALAASLGSGGLPGFGGGIRGEVASPAVAPGGWLVLEGQRAPDGADLILESRTGEAAWHTVAQGSADGDGDFVLRGRALERPGRIEVRARIAGGNATTKPVAVTVRPLRLLAVGDINLDGAPGNAWQTTGKALRRADLSFGNLESAVSTGGVPFPKQYNFRGTPAALAALHRQSGLDVLNLANNHVGDYGPQATIDTVRRIERLGMKAVGAGPDLKRALAPQVVRRLGLRIAFVGFSEIAPIEFAAAPGQPGTAWAKPAQIVQAVQAARRQADIVVATFHWGIEKQTLETAQQRALADVAVRAGAQVVIGAHPHTLQPVRRQGAAIVAYSLGNFVFAAQSPETTTTGILELDLTAEGVAKANWRAARISAGRPVLDRAKPRRLPLRDSLRMQAGVNLPEL